MSELPPSWVADVNGLYDPEIDRIIAKPGIVPIIGEGEDGAERFLMRVAALNAISRPALPHASKRRVLSPMQSRHRAWRESPNPVTAEAARRKLEEIYARWRWGASYNLFDDVPQTPQQNYNFSPETIDAAIEAAAAQDQISWRPPADDSYTALLLIAYERLFGEPAETMEHFERTRASIARVRKGKDGQPKERGGAVFFVMAFESELEAAQSALNGSRPGGFKPRSQESVRNHIGQIG